MVPIDWIQGKLANRMFQGAYIFAQHKKGLIPDTWVQYAYLFHEFEKEIQEYYGEGIRIRRPEVSIHVRRGDYVGHHMFVNLAQKTDYYERAMALFPGRNFLMFSDDPEWCAKRWKDPHITVVRGGTEITDLNQMAECSDNIIANSSFSWWGAYLNRNPEKRVVYPLLWHTDGVSRVGFPPGWQGI